MAHAEQFDVTGATLTQCREFVGQIGLPAFRGQQLWEWVHRQRVTSFDDMKNLPAAMRDQLKRQAKVETLQIDEVQRSSDGTQKMRLLTHDGHAIESVLIPDGDKLTQCISSQVGCALGCDFCATAKLGLKRHLQSGEIVAQVYRGLEVLKASGASHRVTNLVYMGMGEPLHNYDNVMQSIEILTQEKGLDLSPRRITVSTVGLVSGIERLATETRVMPNIAVSLNASTNESRDVLMPVNRKFKIERLLQALRDFPLPKRRRITFEYVLLAGVNDSPADARRVAKLLSGMPAKLNIIPWNPHPEAPYERPSDDAIALFQKTAKSAGVATYLRRPRGDDIDAACGQLANKKQLPVVKSA